jgi:hypothetical protein
MDERRHPLSLKAPGHSGSGSPLHLPGRDSFPRVDDRLVEAEVTRDEILGGRRVIASPANAPHGDQHTELDYVLRAHVAPGYRASVDLLTRHDDKSDFATDASVRREGLDPETGARHLEELAFEVVSEQSEADVAEKAERMHRRGVRRIFALFVKGARRVAEWSAERGSWRALDPGSQIEDRCLVKPLAIASLLDAAAADNAVAEALLAKGNPVLAAREAAAKTEGRVEGRVEGRAEGRAEGLVEGEAKARAEGILKALAARGIGVTAAERQKILRCRSLERLDVWFDRALVASTLREVLADP